MKVDTTDAVRGVVERARAERSGTLSITIGTGCCESTAPFLYEDYWPGPDAQPVGEVAGVVIYAPEHLRRLYPGDDGATIDVIDIDAESMSLETAWGQRLVLRGQGFDADASSEVGVDGGCDLPQVSERLRTVASFDPSDPDRPGARVRGELPAVLRNLRLR